MKKILITGSTGFLGGAVVANLLQNSVKDRLLLLVRGETVEDGLNRLKVNLKNFGLNDSTISTIAPENIILGDLALTENFINDSRLNDVTHVINCAAVASFGNNPTIWKVNVEGTFQFAERMSRIEGLKKFIHVGTAMSCAPEPGSLVTEGGLDSSRDQHVVEYTWSKASIEKLMTKKLPGLPLVIARPSIVVGHSDQGCLPSASIFWVFRMVLALGKFTCDLDDRIDVVPVDYCADALVMLLDAEDVINEVIHISAGTQSSVTFAEIDEAMAKASGSRALGVDYQKVSYKQLSDSRRTFRDLFGPCNERIMLRAMNLYGHFSNLNVVFDNSKLLQLGMNKPSRFTDYLDRCVMTTRDSTIAELMQVDFK
ncbi:Nucleoside-diphosphate-sugar epimerase [Candidatus Pantoea varia]|uniref:Nucleoside-diphosphate-sugar epimerase n=1 Tax=Candidatus Pantoea varia TaxID=1881036 RepID=A0A1I5EYQ4_9GAMM|nr:SDR family oxidoreductase [Pantoea varia]SFO16658.1 Nucleoside-diphosphate-sugar epimerase [Pantoea varia]